MIPREINSKWKANNGKASSRFVREQKFIKRETRAIVNLDISFPYRDNGCPFITVANVNSRYASSDEKLSTARPRSMTSEHVARD